MLMEADPTSSWFSEPVPQDHRLLLPGSPWPCASYGPPLALEETWRGFMLVSFRFPIIL